MEIKKMMRNHYFVAFFSTLVVTMGLLIASFLLPPQGKIDPSALMASAELFMWPTLAFGAKAVCECRRCKEKEESQEKKN